MAADGFDDAPLDRLTRTAGPDPMVLAGALAGAASAIARLDQALASHPWPRPFFTVPGSSRSVEWRRSTGN